MPYDFERSPAFLAMTPAERADFAIAEYIERASGTRTGGLAVSTVLQYLKALEWWWTMVPKHDLLGMSADAYRLFWAVYTTRTKTTDGRQSGRATTRVADGATLQHTPRARRRLLNQPEPMGGTMAVRRRGSYKSPTSLSANTKALRALAIRHFLGWWYEGRAVDGTVPWKGIVMVHPDKSSSKRAIQKKSLQSETVTVLLETAQARLDAAPRSARAEYLLESLWISMMYGMGLRLHEPLTIPHARPMRVELDSDVLYQVDVTRKGNAHVLMTLPDDILPLFDEWMAHRPVSQGDDANTLLIHPRTGKRLSVVWMSRRIKQVVQAAIHRQPALPDFANCVTTRQELDAAGKPFVKTIIQVSSHWLRHSIITHLVEDGHPLPVVAEIANHKDVQTTMTYLDAIKERSPHVLKRVRLHRPGRDEPAPNIPSPSPAYDREAVRTALLNGP